MTTQSAGEQHTGTLNLTGDGNRLPNAIDTQAVEAATRAHIENAGWDWDDLGNDQLEHEAAKAVLLADMRVALRAAYPAIRQQVAEEIAAKADEIAESYQKSAEYYRAISLEVGSGEPKGQRYMRTALSFKNNAAGAWAVMHAARDIGGLQ